MDSASIPATMDSASTRLLNIPELALAIALFLDKKDISQLMQASHGLHNMFAPCLYQDFDLAETLHKLLTRRNFMQALSRNAGLVRTIKMGSAFGMTYYDGVMLQKHQQQQSSPEATSSVVQPPSSSTPTGNMERPIDDITEMPPTPLSPFTHLSKLNFVLITSREYVHRVKMRALYKRENVGADCERHFGSLNIINLTICSTISTKALQMILFHCSLLTSLKVSGDDPEKFKIPLEDVVAEPWASSKLKALYLVIDIGDIDILLQDRRDPTACLLDKARERHLEKLFRQIGKQLELEALELRVAVNEDDLGDINGDDDEGRTADHWTFFFPGFLTLTDEATGQYGFLGLLAGLSNLRYLLGSLAVGHSSFGCAMGQRECAWMVEHRPKLKEAGFYATKADHGILDGQDLLDAGIGHFTRNLAGPEAAHKDISTDVFVLIDTWIGEFYYNAFINNFQDPLALIEQSGDGTFAWGPLKPTSFQSDLLYRPLPPTPSEPLIRLLQKDYALSDISTEGFIGSDTHIAKACILANLSRNLTLLRVTDIRMDDGFQLEVLAGKISAMVNLESLMLGLKVVEPGVEVVHPKAVQTILVECGALEKFEVRQYETHGGLFITLEDAIEKPWACTRVQRFDLTVGVSEREFDLDQEDPYYLRESPIVLTPAEEQLFAMLEKLYRQVGLLTEVRRLDLRLEWLGDEGFPTQNSAYNTNSFPALLSLGDARTNRPGYLHLLAGLKKLQNLRGSVFMDVDETEKTVDYREVVWMDDNWRELTIAEFFLNEEGQESRECFKWLKRQREHDKISLTLGYAEPYG
ncbi:hypothetical protein BGW39_002309 [Mortierella sp. 14UC]|nr:hypothetical protein BGW39_002309 [Mortierella sp. 14UC]